MALTRAAATLLRLESVELRDSKHVGLVDPQYSIHMFAPGYIGVAGVAMALHFVPLPQPWGLLTFVITSYLFGLAVFHMSFALGSRFIECRLGSDARDAVASVLGLMSCLASLVLLSFLAPGPLGLLYR